jgi:hypothetical protein
MTVWIVILEDRHCDIGVDVYETEDLALSQAATLVRDYDKNQPPDCKMQRADHSNGVVSWTRDDGPTVTVEPKEVERG